MEIILGIDPGSRSTGYGILCKQSRQIVCIAHGHIRCQQETFAERLHHIQERLHEVIQHFKPTQVAIERVFTHRNPQSALKLGQARGVALAVAAHYALDIFEYSPRQIKQAIVGYGDANKLQIQKMISVLLNLQNKPQADAADALAIALCHCHTQRFTIQPMRKP